MLIRTDNKESIFRLLKNEPIINLNIIGILKNVDDAEVYVDDIDNPRGVFVKRGYFHYMYTKDDVFINQAMDQFIKEGYHGFSGLENTIAEKIKARYGKDNIDWESPCRLYYMPKENLNTNLIKNKAVSVNIEDAEVVDSLYTYRNDGSLDEIKRDILNRPSSAIYVDGEIVCWVLTHPDNSMGIMYTKEEHRNKGYAVDVTLDLASKIIARGDTPFVHINKTNAMSPGLAAKCGFVEVGEVSWFGLALGV